MKPGRRHKRKRRVIVIGLCFGILITVIGARAVYLQVWQTSWLSERAADQYAADMRAPAKRGIIYDAKLRPMAVSIDVHSVAAYPARIADVGATATALASALAADRRAIEAKLSTDKGFVWLKRQASPRQAEAIRDLKIAGVDFIPEHSRFYPNTSIAAQLIGFSGIDGHGLEGLEYYYNDHLEGHGRTITVLKDALGRRFDSNGGDDGPRAGDNLVLTIDRNIQFIAETVLQDVADTFDAASGIALVMRPETGAVLAMAHTPLFNPNAFRRFDRRVWRNRAVTDSFEPGSTMKIFTAAAAIENGSSTPGTTVFCEKGRYQIGRHAVHDTEPHENLTLTDVIRVSSNIGAVKIAERLGSDALYRQLERFGFGQKTGIDCPGETSGHLAHARRWTVIDRAAIAFGQGIAVSAVQLVTAVSAIANDGLLMKPHVVQAITDRHGRFVRRFEPTPVRHAVSPSTARDIRRIMTRVVSEDGTGKYAALDGYAACGKTGTAQKPSESGAYADDRFIASFVGFAPADNPAVAVLVVFDEPKTAHYGGVVAAPAFKRIVEETLHYLNVPPHGDRSRMTAEAAGGAAG